MRRSRFVTVIVAVVVFLGCGMFLSQATGHASVIASSVGQVADAPLGSSVDVGHAGQWAVAGLLGIGAIGICLRPRRRAVTTGRDKKNKHVDVQQSV